MSLGCLSWRYGDVLVCNFQPVIGGWVDSATEQQEALGLTGNELQLAVGQTALTNMLLFGILIVVYHFILLEKKTQNS